MKEYKTLLQHKINTYILKAQLTILLYKYNYRMGTNINNILYKIFKAWNNAKIFSITVCSRLLSATQHLNASYIIPFLIELTHIFK